MIEVYKAALNVEQIKAKKEQLGALHFEIQLLQDDVGCAANLVKKASECISYMDDVVSVHTALMSDDNILVNGNCSLNFLENQSVEQALNDAMLIAQMCATNYKHNVGVVIHNSMSYLEFVTYRNSMSEICRILRYLLSSYPNVELWIENVSPIYEGGSPYMRNGVLDDAPLIADYLSTMFKGRVHTVLDTCHLMITDCIFRNMLGKDVFTDTLKSFRGNCKEIHLANVRDLGFGNGKHGCGFCDNDYEELKDIITALRENIPNALLCYEIYESDYLNNENVKKTKELVHKILDELNEKGVK